ncbi:hypothetical protein [Mesorhizobium sp. 1M-11]|uniref:hypothetical protein n=1 Tax=Mesorhizobium sp. 1M-11 TaxID=1529006 RepID=UPI0006C73CBF|nr:hypothetical protein [Mesorhizobium sp. 1M-11]
MLNHQDLNRALKLFEERKTAMAMRSRLDSEPVRLMVGDGATAGTVALSPSYLGGIVGDVKASLDQQIAVINSTLTAMGIEP